MTPELEAKAQRLRREDDANARRDWRCWMGAVRAHFGLVAGDALRDEQNPLFEAAWKAVAEAGWHRIDPQRRRDGMKRRWAEVDAAMNEVGAAASNKMKADPPK